MSTKTSLKRIALFAVSILGLGIFSAAPSKAAFDVTKTSLSVSAVGRVGVGIHILISAGYGNTASKLDSSSRCHTRMTAAPSTAGILAPDANPNTNYAATDSFTAFVNDSITVSTPGGGDYDSSTDACYIVLSQDNGLDSYTAGTYSFLVWVDESTANNDQPTAGSSVSANVSVTLGGTPASFVLTSSSATPESSTNATNLVEATIRDSAGVDTILKDLASASNVETFTVKSGGTGWNKALIADSNTAVSALPDANWLEAGEIDSALATSNHFTPDMGNRFSATHYLASKIRFYVGTNSSSTTTFTIVGGSNLAAISSGAFTLSPTSGAKISSIQASSGTRFAGTRADARGSGYSMGVVSSSYAFPDAVTSGTSDSTSATTLYASTVTGKTVNFQITTAAAGLVRVSVAAVSTSTPVPTGVATGSHNYTSDTVTTVKAFTATSPIPGDSYAVTFLMGDGTSFIYNVVYQAPTVASGVGSMTTNIDSTAKAAIGSTNTVRATVKDQFEQLVSGATVRMTHNRTATGATSAVVTATTDASGVAEFTFTDALVNSTLTPTAAAGTVTLTANTANSTTSLAPGGKSIQFTSATYLTPGSITITENAEDNDLVGNLVDASLAETITVKTETGTVMAGIAYTATISDGLYEDATTSTLTGFTDSNGQAKVVIAGYKSGVQTVTFTVGSLSASDTFTVVSSTSLLRALSVDKTELSINTGDTAYVTVTAKDVYGNVVPSATLTVAYMGATGRVVSFNGAQGNSAVTNSAGELVVGIYGEGTGTGSLTVSYASATTADSTNQGVAPIARVASVVTSVTTSGVAPAIAAAEAASDAALEAIDAANAATDAANLAAEAADAATVAAEEARDAADAATAAVEALASEVSTLIAGLKAQITTLAKTVAKIAKKVKA